MCELLGMSSNVPSDICFSFTGLAQRGGKTGPHKDGWGVAFYEGRGCRVFHDPSPSAQSEMAKFIKHYPIHSKNVICHIRKANRGRVCLENTHPFTRELWGRIWCFAHNGQLKGVKKSLTLEHHRPVGTTDSEHVFCWMLDKIYQQFPLQPANQKKLIRYIEDLSAQVAQFGVFNMLLCDAKNLYSHCSTKMCYLTRQAPFSHAKLIDEDLAIDFQHHLPKDARITIIATTPLTTNEIWHKTEKNQFIVWHNGLMVNI